MSLICGHTTPEPFTCRICFLYLTRDDYNRLLKGNGLKVKPALGDWVAWLLERLGIRKKPQCGCARRQEQLNSWWRRLFGT